jgi:hypothetical protein
MLAALNKYFRSVSYDEYMDKWDLPFTQNAVAVASFPKEVEIWIWEPKPFMLF